MKRTPRNQIIAHTLQVSDIAVGHYSLHLARQIRSDPGFVLCSARPLALRRLQPQGCAASLRVYKFRRNASRSRGLSSAVVSADERVAAAALSRDASR